jgi:hypothetical protein
MGKGKLLTQILSFLFIAFSVAPSRAAEFKPNWQVEWERTVQAAKKEGALSLYLLQGDGELDAVAQIFQKKYPEITVVTTPGQYASAAYHGGAARGQVSRRCVHRRNDHRL